MKVARLFALILSTALLFACSSGGPAGAAKQWYEAVATADGATALSLTCEQYQSQVQMAGFLTAGVGMLSGGSTQSMKVDMSDVKFTTISQSGDTALVHIEGEVIVSLLGAAMPQDLDSNLRMVREDGRWKMCGEE